MRGFTLVELAIVIVIAGILAAVAIPIYQGLVEESKWSEGKTAAGSIRHSLQTHQAKNSGELPGIATGETVVVFGPIIKWESDAFDDLKNFAGSSFVINGSQAAFDTVNGTYTLQVIATSGGPDGTYFIDHAGNETEP